MGWDGIEEFVAVAGAGSFVGGAKQLGLSTSHVSRAIATLEDRIHARLFFRTTRRVSLTDTGRVLVDHCRRMIQERDEALAMVGGGEEPQGELRLTCSTTLGERYVAPLVRRFVQDNPRISMTFELTNRVVDIVAEGFDLAVRTGHLPDSRLIGTRIASRRLHLCASAAYLDRAGRPRDIADLDGHECLIGTAQTWHFEVDGAPRSYRPRGRWRCNSGTAVAEAARAGLGICQLPEFYVLEPLANGTLEPLLEHRQGADEPIWAVYPERRHLLPKVRLLVELLKRELGARMEAERGDLPAPRPGRR